MNHNDLRVIKTKKALSQSLYELLEKHMFTTISVNQICDNAMVHRTTFYKHFYDKYDLLIYLIKLLTKDYLATDIKERFNNPFKTIYTTFQNKAELQRIQQKQQDDKEFEKVVSKFIIDTLKNDIKENQHRIIVDRAVPESLIFYIYGSTLAGFVEWARCENPNMDADKMDKIFHKVVNLKIRD